MNVSKCIEVVDFASIDRQHKFKGRELISYGITG
jgi:hypothetical protein